MIVAPFGAKRRRSREPGCNSAALLAICSSERPARSPTAPAASTVIA